MQNSHQDFYDGSAFWDKMPKQIQCDIYHTVIILYLNSLITSITLQEKYPHECSVVVVLGLFLTPCNYSHANTNSVLHWSHLEFSSEFLDCSSKRILPKPYWCWTKHDKLFKDTLYLCPSHAVTNSIWHSSLCICPISLNFVWISWLLLREILSQLAHYNYSDNQSISTLCSAK